MAKLEEVNLNIDCNFNYLKGSYIQMSRVIAMYLPQFHRTTENDAWWGEGFTDWVSAKKAKPLFDGHYQPHIPLNDYYYNLLDKETMLWQSNLMHKYGIDGICMYHYWFKNGRRALEKPEQNLLEWKDIDMPFCFCWANESWARSWSNIKNTNAWNIADAVEERVGDGILLLQEYGSRNDWEEHFEYLLPYFKDERYIKLNGKPVFLFYKTNEIGCVNEMIDCWKCMAKENNLPGIYFVGNMVDEYENNNLDACVYIEPGHAIGNSMELLYHDGITRLSYSGIWNTILSDPGSVMNTYFGGIVGYDDSPRRGIKGKVIENSTPELFGGFLAELIAKNAARGNEYIFINAWNEWGEGMHLEPDVKYGYKYLEKVKLAKESYVDLIPYYSQIKRQISDDRNEKFELYLNDLDMWMGNREKGKTIGKWLLSKGYHSIAVYGYGIMGRHLISEIQRTDGIDIKYIVEKRKEAVDIDYPVFYPDENLTPVDVILVSSYFYWDEIVKDLSLKENVLPLRDVIHEIAVEKR